MFDFVRKHTRVMQLILFLLIFPSFVLFGLEGYNRMQESGPAVAKVDGKPITQADWDAEHKAQADRLRQQMPTLDARVMDTPEARYATLERMVRDRVLTAAAARMRLSASDQRLARELQQNEVIAALRGSDGKLDMERYKQLVGSQGLTPQAFEEQVRREIAERQVLEGVMSTGPVLQAQASVALGAFFERREVQVARFDAASYASKVNPTPADLEAYYKANTQLFQAPESATIEYVVFDLDAARKSVTISEADLKSYYDQNAPRLEERRASHILIAVPKGAPAAEKDKARARAQELLQEARKSPDRFAELARKNSQDPGSAPNGGDLDFFTRNAMTKPFEDAAFALKKGDISDVVETEFGFHIIRLTDVKGRTFEQMRPELEERLRKEQAQRKFAETADEFSNAVYESTDGLKSVADKFKLQVRTAANVTRTPQPGTTGALASERFLSALFAPESLEKKRNTAAVEIGSSQLVSGRIVQHSPARTLPLAEVQDTVRQRVVAAKAAEMARKEGEEKLASWKANPASANVGDMQVVSRNEPGRQPQQVVEAALRADPSALPAIAGVDLGTQGYAVVKVMRTVPRTAPEGAQARQEVQQYSRAWTNAEAMAYYDVLKERYKAQILVPKPAAATAEAPAR